VRFGPELVDDRMLHREQRLSEPEAVHLAALVQEPSAALVDGQRCGPLEPAFAEKRFFFEDELEGITAKTSIPEPPMISSRPLRRYSRGRLSSGSALSSK